MNQLNHKKASEKNDSVEKGLLAYKCLACSPFGTVNDPLHSIRSRRE